MAAALTFILTTPTDEFGFWEIVSGADFCQIVDGGRCVTDGELWDYGHNENCEIKALRPLVATATEFHTEEDDYLEIDGYKYDGSEGPLGLVLGPDAELMWQTDHLSTEAGFTVCASEPQGSFVVTPTLHDFKCPSIPHILTREFAHDVIVSFHLCAHSSIILTATATLTQLNAHPHPQPAAKYMNAHRSPAPSALP